jgi:hypothetical protein
MNNLKNAVGLLNAQAPEGEFLAYINADEAKMLKDAGGAGLLTPQGIPTYFSAMYGGGAGDRGGDPRASAAENVSAGRDDRGNVQRAEDYRLQQNQTNIPPTVIEEPTFTGEGYDSTNTFEKPENKVKTFFNDVKDYVMSGGAIGQAFDKFGKPIQKKMMTYSLEKRIDKISNKKDFHPGAYGYKIQDLQKDLQGVKDGTFTQNDFTKKYGSGDVTNPNDKFYNPDALRENDITDLETYFAPELADIIGGTAPQESMVNEYFANINNNNLGINSAYMDTYNKAKSDMAAKLQLTNNTQQYGYTPYPYQNNSMTLTSANPFFDELNNQGLI